MDFYAISTPFMPAMKYGLSVIGIPFPLTCKRPALEVTENSEANGRWDVERNYI